MQRWHILGAWLLFVGMIVGIVPPHCWAHDVPMTYLKVRVGQNAAEIEMDIPWTGLRHDIEALGGVNSDAPPTAALVAAQARAIQDLIATRLTLLADGRTQKPTFFTTVLADERPVVHVTLAYPWRDASGNIMPPPDTLTLQGNLFPTAADHQTMVSIYRGSTLEREVVLSASNPDVTHRVGGRQSVLEVIRQFIRQGIHHIFIGPDHILFIIGLLLAGGNLRTLLKVVTAFTAAHSITLALAVLGIVSLPSRLVEPTIAASIVFVGINTLLKGQESRDLRLYLAFGFGLIHGFGFAGALQETELPRYALGWSLFAFNGGVEIGQACIVLLVTPLLALLAHHRPGIARNVVQGGALTVIFFGALWFVQRLIGE